MGAVPAAAGTPLSAPDSAPPDWSGLPIEQDTTDLRAGPEISQRLLALLPLVGVWRGTGQIDDGTSVLAIGAQAVFAHDGRDFLSYEQRLWIEPGAPGGAGRGAEPVSAEASGEPMSAAPVAREAGYWRRGFGQDAVEVVIVDPAGGLAGLTGVAGNARYEIASDVRANAPTGQLPEPERRMYAVRGDRLLVVGERHDGQRWQPRLNLSLGRVRAEPDA